MITSLFNLRVLKKEDGTYQAELQSANEPSLRQTAIDACPYEAIRIASTALECEEERLQKRWEQVSSLMGVQHHDVRTMSYFRRRLYELEEELKSKEKSDAG